MSWEPRADLALCADAAGFRLNNRGLGIEDTALANTQQKRRVTDEIRMNERWTRANAIQITARRGFA